MNGIEKNSEVCHLMPDMSNSTALHVSKEVYLLADTHVIRSNHVFIMIITPFTVPHVSYSKCQSCVLPTHSTLPRGKNSIDWSTTSMKVREGPEPNTKAN